MDDKVIHKWVQTTSFVPGKTFASNGQGTNQPSNMHAAASEGSTLNLDELESQLIQQINHEREQHAATKKLLKNEQQKVRKLQKELDRSDHFANELAAGILLNANVLQAAMDRIEPDVKEILRTVAALNAPNNSPSDGGALATAIDHQKLLGNTAHQAKSSSSPPRFQKPPLQLSAPNSTDKRPSILYDVLAKERMDDVDTVSNFHSVLRHDIKHEPVQRDTLRQADEAENKQQTSNGVNVGPASVQPSEEVDRAHSISEFESRPPGLGEFHSLDEAFENDFFSKLVGGSDTERRLSNKKTSDNSLIDMDLEEGVLPSSDVVRSVSYGNGTSKPKEALTSGEDLNKLAAGSVVVRKESTIEHPIIGVEARTKHAIPLKLDQEISKSPPKLSSLPTLCLPTSFLSKAEVYKVSTSSVGSAASSLLEAPQSTALAPARAPRPPIHPQIKALQNIKMSDTSNSSEETIRPSSRQCRAQGLAPRSSNNQHDLASETSNMNPEAIAAYELATGYRTQQWVSDVDDDGDDVAGPSGTHLHPSEQQLDDVGDFAGPSGTNFPPFERQAGGLGDFAGPSGTNLRPSSGPGDNYDVIPVQMRNYLRAVEWKMSKDHNPLFTSDFEKYLLQTNEINAPWRNSPLWTHGLRYEPPVDELDTHRTVQIDHIPKETTVQELLREVCYGAVESIQLFDVGRVEMAEGLVPCPYKFARVVFIRNENATKFEQYACRKPLTIRGQLVRVYVQMEPTYPRTTEVDETIFVMGMYRILSVFGMKNIERYRLPEFIRRFLRVELVSLEERPNAPRGDENDRFKTKTVMEFRSVLHARKAFERMKDGGYYGVAGFMAEPDYCAREGD